ncbi:MAG: M67 family metallopeptidase [Chloroherpetonaceae bacterium]|nr:M67 family metallopeptidase [Chloroherpetonaceae bacterium]MCS7212273.1 M67 family metallopeptidase [Chloroherpetonaceae bacterium]MDW8020270.1 M67 family metallopeptidase [Chloroherpetonaceae bacterium]
MLQLSRTTLEAMQQHAVDTFPEECGGLLLGYLLEDARNITLVVTEILPLPNVRLEARHNRIEIDPLDYVKAERLALKKGLGVWGFYHSHPNAPAIPSEFDRLHFPFTNWWYPIVSVTATRQPEVRCWKLSPTRDSFSEEIIRLSDTCPTASTA